MDMDNSCNRIVVEETINSEIYTLTSNINTFLSFAHMFSVLVEKTYVKIFGLFHTLLIKFLLKQLHFCVCRDKRFRLSDILKKKGKQDLKPLCFIAFSNQKIGK